MSAYCRYVDTKQWESLHEVLAEDARTEFKNTEGETIASFNNPSELVDSFISLFLSLKRCWCPQCNRIFLSGKR